MLESRILPRPKSRDDLPLDSGYVPGRDAAERIFGRDTADTSEAATNRAYAYSFILSLKNGAIHNGKRTGDLLRNAFGPNLPGRLGCQMWSETADDLERLAKPFESLRGQPKKLAHRVRRALITSLANGEIRFPSRQNPSEEIDDDLLYFEEAPVPALTWQFCGKCGQRSQPDWRYCRKCGELVVVEKQ